MSLRPVLFPAIVAVALSGCGINSVPTAEEGAKAAWAEVQNQYQRRSDLIPNLVATAKAASTQEKDVLVQVTQARASANAVKISASDLTDPAKFRQFEQAQNAVSGSLLQLRQMQEAYPEITSQGNYPVLIHELEATENRIAIARRDYNGAVRDYNTRIRTFPDAVGAKVFYGAKPMTPFSATPGSDVAPKVNFG